MVRSSQKKKSPVIFFLVALLVIIIVMFIANRSSTLEHELKAPLGGVAKLYTVENQLIAISQDNEVYVWNWEQLQDKP